MFSGKTTLLLGELYEFAVKGLKTMLIMHEKNTRDEDKISHFPTKIPDSLAIVRLSKLNDIFLNPDIVEYDVIGIDEAQFFDDLISFVDNIKLSGDVQVSDIISVERNPESKNIYLIVSGLNGDYEMKKFGHVVDLICKSDKITMLTAKCTECYRINGEHVEARFTKRIVKENGQILVGGSSEYIPVCKKHHESS